MTAARVRPGSVPSPRSFAGEGRPFSASGGRGGLSAHGKGVALAGHRRPFPRPARRIKELDRCARHDRADGVLVDKLGMSIPPEQNGEIVEPGNDPLQFDAVHEKYRYGSLALANMVQEHVLHVLGLLGGHGAVLLFFGGCKMAARRGGLIPLWYHQDRKSVV